MARTYCSMAWGVPENGRGPPGGTFTAFGVVYIMTLSRTGPPSSRWTGTPQSLPVMSHSAMSMPANVWVMNGPPRMSRCER